MSPWSREQVESVAPDSTSVAAARALADRPTWQGEGADGRAVWGECTGSGKNPYRTVIDLDGPAFQCSCPSRKFPCKHALAVLLRWVAGGIPTGRAPDWVATWLTARDERAGRAAERADSADTAASSQAGPKTDPAVRAASAARTAAQRDSRVQAGLGELERWLADQVRAGLGGIPSGGYGVFEPVAARMIDAQLPGVAARLRALPGVVASGTGWPDRLLEELALLHLLARAHAGVDTLDLVDPDLAATVRQHAGARVRKEAVRATPGVLDGWLVCAVAEASVGPLRQRTHWLWGERNQRWAVLISFAANALPFDIALPAGQYVVGDLHFYPGAGELRALPAATAKTESWPVDPFWRPPATLVAGALDAVAARLALDPWAASHPVWVEAAPRRVGSAWVLCDDLGEALPLMTAEAEPWPLVALCGGRPLPVFAEWTPTGWLPRAAVHDGAVVSL